MATSGAHVPQPKIAAAVLRWALINVVAGVGRMRMDEVTPGVIPFMHAEFGVMFHMVAYPWLVTGPANWFAG